MQGQEMRPGRTISGKPGLFTNGMLAWPLSEEEWADMHSESGWERLAERMARMGFVLVLPDGPIE